MKIAFIHFHLKTGGVTTVIKQQIESLKNDCEILVLTGEPAEPDFPAETVCIPGIGYDEYSNISSDPEETAELATDAIFSRWKGGCDLLHVHNPCLAKNKNLLKILKKLQKTGVTLFIQIHDFAEDGRPSSYYFDDEYTQDCHYGVINSRDYGILLRSGLKPEGLHMISNTVNRLPSPANAFQSESFILYPVRAIRRKNIGEAVLVSIFFKNHEKLAITRPPNSPEDANSYKGWRKFSNDHSLNVDFEVALTRDFIDLVQSAQCFITTSITEGFGFSFLEPWTARKSLWGRKLPDICNDFDKNGINLDHLYTAINIPLSWLGEKTVFKTWEAAFKKNCRLLNYPPDLIDIDKGFAHITTNSCIDFGLLNEKFQKEVISRVLTGDKAIGEMAAINPDIVYKETCYYNKELIENNYNKVLENYNTDLYRRNLLDIYSAVVKKTVKQQIDKKKLLAQFLTPENFSLLKWSDYAE